MTMGCSRLAAVRRVILPLALPGLAAAAIFVFIISWNDVFAASVLTLRHRTLPAQVLTAAGEAPLPYRVAGAWFLLAPSLVVIFLIRKYLFTMWGRVVK
jgi:multiple sugar transport system permease protein